MNTLHDLEQSLHQRFGPQALRPLAEVVAPEIAVIPTGFPALDEALGIGGIACGHITTLIGGVTSGITTLALTTIAQCQQMGGYSALVDVDAVFAPDIALRQGIDLDRLLLVQPEDTAQALNITRDLAASGDVALVALDWIGQSQHIPLHRLSGLLARSGTALVVLTDHPASLSGTDSLRLHLQVVDWWYCFGDVIGYRSQVRLLRNKFAPVGEPVWIDLGVEDV